MSDETKEWLNKAALIALNNGYTYTKNDKYQPWADDLNLKLRAQNEHCYYLIMSLIEDDPQKPGGME